jgi:hypothetical protein
VASATFSFISCVPFCPMGDEQLSFQLPWVGSYCQLPEVALPKSREALTRVPERPRQYPN